MNESVELEGGLESLDGRVNRVELSLDLVQDLRRLLERSGEHRARVLCAMALAAGRPKPAERAAERAEAANIAAIREMVRKESS